MNNVFYIPILSVNLSHYLRGGIIAPTFYLDNRNEDIQSRFGNSILLSACKFTTETNCAVEVVLHRGKEEVQQISNNFYLFQMPMPISRIKGIFFQDEDKKKLTHFNIESGAAYIPNELLKISNDSAIETTELDNIKYERPEKDWNSLLKQYDQVLGGFALINISKESFQNYSTHYFSALGNINQYFSRILQNQNVDIDNKFKFAFSDVEKFKSFSSTIYQTINEKVIKEYALKDKIEISFRNGLIRIEEIPEDVHTYLVAILGSYGEGKRKKVDEFISDLASNKFSISKKEGLALTFGINQGYRAFRNKYQTSNFQEDIKFKLNSKLDYYIIESIYQKTFNSVDDASAFPFIEELGMTFKDDKIDYSKYETYNILDKTIIWKEKTLSPIDKLLDMIYRKIVSWFPLKLFKLNPIEIKEEFEKEVKSGLDSIQENTLKEIELNKDKIKELTREIGIRDEQILILKKEVNKLTLMQENNILKEPSAYEMAVIDENNPNSLFPESKSSLSDVLSRLVALGKKNKVELQTLANEIQINFKSSDNIITLISKILKHEFGK